jgi:hypothetical protein
VMAIVERKSGADSLLVGREDREFVFSWKGKVVRVVAEGGQEDSWGRRLQTKKKKQ